MAERDDMTTETPERVGLYIRVDTRNRLNLFKAQLTIELGRNCSQDDAINYLIDRIDQVTHVQPSRK